VRSTARHPGKLGEPRVELFPRLVTAAVYLSDPDDYDASAQIALYADRAWIFAIAGAGFYLAFPELLARLRAEGVRVVEGYVRRAHYRLLAREARKAGLACTLAAEPGRAFGRDMVWVTLRFSGVGE
jgi:hypothetical protein